MHFCYILRNDDDQTYNGYTNNPWKRIRQHNGEIVGGAKYTRGKSKWQIYVLLTGFKTYNNALSCEWKIKHPTGAKMRPKKYCGVEGRVKSLNVVLNLDKWTSKCIDENKDCQYILFIVNDMVKYLEDVPDNITIVAVDEITEEFVDKEMKLVR